MSTSVAVDWNDVVGSAELAARLNVKKGTVWSWKARGEMPDPDAIRSNTPLWSWSETIAPWARERGLLND